MVRVVVRVRGRDEVAEFAALWRWLRQDPDFGGRLTRVDKPATATELSGGLPQAIEIALGGAGLALARSLSVYLRTRRPDATLTLEDAGSDGVAKKATLTVRNGDDRQVDAAQELMRAFLRGAAPDAAATSAGERETNA